MLNNQNFKLSIIKASSNLVQKKGPLIIILSTVIVIFSLTGSAKLIVENSFINYFKKIKQRFIKEWKN